MPGDGSGGTPYGERPMSMAEAKSVFKREVERFRTMPYDQFVQVAVVQSGVYTAEHMGASGTRYLLELKTKRKKRNKNVVRVSASLRCLDESLREPQSWNIPVLNIPISVGMKWGVVTRFTRRPE